MRAFSALMVALVIPFLLAMDGTSSDGDLEIPQPEQKFDAVVTDNTGTITRLSKFTWDGFVHVQGGLGSGTVAIPFERIDRIDFEPGERGKIAARVALKSGEVVRLTVSGRLTCYGKTSFGNYRVQARDMRRLEFVGLAPEATPSPKEGDDSEPTKTEPESP